MVIRALPLAQLPLLQLPPQALRPQPARPVAAPTPQGRLDACKRCGPCRPLQAHPNPNACTHGPPAPTGRHRRSRGGTSACSARQPSSSSRLFGGSRGSRMVLFSARSRARPRWCTALLSLHCGAVQRGGTQKSCMAAQQQQALAGSTQPRSLPGNNGKQLSAPSSQPLRSGDGVDGEREQQPWGQSGHAGRHAAPARGRQLRKGSRLAQAPLALRAQLLPPHRMTWPMPMLNTNGCGGREAGQGRGRIKPGGPGRLSA